jgi:hypothetical protein
VASENHEDQTGGIMIERRLRQATAASIVFSAAMALAAWLHPVRLWAASTITYVQGNYATPQAPQTSVTIPFTAAQSTGDLNVVVVGWNDTTATISTVTDKSGNAYTRAVGPTVVTGSLSQSIYYAKNIAAAIAGANAVTVTFSTAATYPDIRILEYRGTDTNNPVDVVGDGSGTSKTSSSSAATTTNATDLIFGANTVSTLTTRAGSGFTKRLLTAPDGDIAEDQMVTTTGAYSATAPLSSSGPWVMQMVAFRTPGAVLGSFALSASPAALSVTQGNQGTSAITSTVSGGFSNSIALSASGAPTGTTISFSPSTIAAPGAGTSTMTITVGSSTPAGTYPITVAGNGGGVQQSTSVTLTVTAGPTFTLAASPASLSVTPGNQGTSTITTSVSGGFSNSIALSASGAPTGTTISFNPSTIAAPGAGTSTMTITVGSSTPAGTYPITVAGNGGGVTQTANVTLAVVGASTAISYVQGNYATPQTSETVVTIPFTSAQSTGDLNIVVVGWNDTTTAVSSVTDKSGNNYMLAVGPTAVGGFVSQSIYYAKNIAGAAAAANAVMVNFSAAAAFPDIRILEYSGADLSNPVDVAAAGSGTSTTSSSATASTTNSTDLIFGANIVYTSTAAPGSGFTTRLLTSPDGDIAEDKMVTATGSYSASATLNSSGPWVMQMVAFRTSSGTTAGLSISPRTAVVTFTETQQFSATGASGTVTWSVDGSVGGSSSSGTITAGGLYTPPTAVGTHVVTASTGSSQSVNANIYVSNYAGTFTYHNDNLRTGQNLNETVLTPTNVNSTQFGKLFSYSLDGIAFASPLYVSNVNIPNKGFHNVVYVVTENDSVYAFDADGRSAAPVWQVSFLKSGVTTVPCADVGECGDIPNQIGITSTPVIDQSTGTLYVVAKTKEGKQYVQRLHALDITTGAEKFGGPVIIQGSVPGSGDGGSGGFVPFDPLRENQRPGLLLNSGVIYLAFGSHGDNNPWHGWVLGYNATTLKQVLVYNVTPNAFGGGIWQGGGALAADASGNIYFATSNGTFDADRGGVDFGDTIEKLAPNGIVADYFTPHDQANMDAGNLDLGAGGPVMLVDQATGPNPHLLITAGKTGTIYVINRDNMGHFNPNSDSQIVQSLTGVLTSGGAEDGNFSTPVYFNGYVYFAAVNDFLKAFQLNNGQLSTAPTSESAARYPCRGGSFAISANGNNNGIIWTIQNLGDPNNDATTPGVLIAYTATDLTHELYDTTQAGSRDTMDFPAKFSIPLVANGKIFIAGQTQLIAYGLLP